MLTARERQTLLALTALEDIDDRRTNPSDVFDGGFNSSSCGDCGVVGDCGDYGGPEEI